MNELARLSHLTYDGEESPENNRMHYDNQDITVYAHLMTKAEYKAMEKEMKAVGIVCDDYVIYAWNDCSGYDYWKQEGECGHSNYINISVVIKADPSKIDAKKLKQDTLQVFYKLQKYDNSDRYYAMEYDKMDNG